MENNKSFNYIVIIPHIREQLYRIMQEIEKLNKAKLSYSIQELQSLDVLDGSRIQESQRILQEANEFLQAADLRGLERSNARDLRKKYDKNLDKMDVSDSIGVDLSNLEQTTFTVADISLKANKYTKWLCEEVLKLITNKLRYK